MIDKINSKLKGHLIVETLKDGKVISFWEDHNLIMELARNSMATSIAGFESSTIDKMVIGTEYSGTEYDPTDTALVSEQSEDNYYNIDWSDKTPVNGETFTTTNNVDSVTIDLLDKNITYTVEVSADNGNGKTYNEAALYVGSNIFSTRGFTDQNKDDTVILRITWTISF